MRATLCCVGLLLMFSCLTTAQQPACCSITAADLATGTVHAKVDSSGQAFTFHLANRAATATLHIGQPIYANFKSKQVSLDGRSIAGTITSVGPAPSVHAATSAPSSQPTPSLATPNPGSKPKVGSPSGGSSFNNLKTDTSKVNVPQGTTTGAIRGATAAGQQSSGTIVTIPTAITSPVVLPKRLVPTVIAQGKQWRLHTFHGAVEGRSLEGETIYHILGRPGILDAPIPQAVKDFLLKDADASPGNDSVYVLHKRSIDLAALGKLGQASHTATGSVTQGSSSTPGCHDAFGWGNTLSQSADIGFSTPGDLLMLSLDDHDFTVVQSGNVTGAVNVSGNLTLKFPTRAQLIGEVQFKILESACVPVGIKLKYIRVAGTIQMQPYLGLDAQLGISAEWRKRVLTQELGGFLFFVGPCPMYLGADAYVDADLRVVLPDLLEVNYALTGQLQGGFDVRCTMNGCGPSSTPNYTQSWSEQHDVHFLPHGLRSNITPAMFIGLQAYLNDPDMAEAHIAVKPYLTGDLWAAAGPICNSYQNGTITGGGTALTADIDAGASLVAGLSLPALLPGLVNSALPDDKELYTYQQHLRFYDLADSTALSPLVQGSTQVEAGTSAAVALRMRSCYPYSDPIEYQVNWSGTAATGTGTGLINAPTAQAISTAPAGATTSPAANPALAPDVLAPQSQVTAAPQDTAVAHHIWTTPGTYTVQAFPLSDQHHRRFPARVTTIQVTVVAPTAGKVGAVGNLTQH